MPKPICVVYVDIFLLDNIGDIQEALERKFNTEYFVIVCAGTASQRRAIEIAVHYDCNVTMLDIAELKEKIMNSLQSMITSRRRVKLGKGIVNFKIGEIPMDKDILCRLDDGRAPVVLNFRLDNEYGIVAPFEEGYISVDRVVEWSIIPK